MEIYIDGYNLLHVLEKRNKCWPLQDNPDRDKGLIYLDGLLTQAQIKANIVLEAKLNHAYLTYSLTSVLGHLTIIDPPSHVCADRFLIERAASHPSPHLLLIITNDLPLTKSLKQLGAVTQKVSAFLSEIEKKALRRKQDAEKYLPYPQEEKDCRLFEERYHALQNKKSKKMF